MKSILDKISFKGAKVDEHLLVTLVDKVRPANGDLEESIKQVQSLVTLLQDNPELKRSFLDYITTLFGRFDPTHVYTTSGILPNKGFFSELKGKLEYKILPPLKQGDDLSLLINTIFHRKDDFEWLIEIPEDLLLSLLKELNLLEYFSNPTSLKTLVGSIQILSHQIVTLSLEPEVLSKLPELDNLNSPFLAQNKEITLFIEEFKEYHFTKLENEKFEHIISLLRECGQYIHQLRKNKKIFGTSLHQTYLTQRLLQHIARLRLLLKLFHENNLERFDHNLLSLVKELVQAENQKYNIRKYISNNIEFLAFQVVSHTAKSGEKYIAENKKQYGKYLLASMYGGFIIAFFACFKVVMDSWDMSPLGRALMFSLNYAACFVLVSLTGGIIATKQPAMTASKLASCMDPPGQDTLPDQQGSLNLHQLKDTIVRVSSSQFISFVGNLICAFPVAYLLSTGFKAAAGASLANLDKAVNLVAEMQPHSSLSVWYAAIAGVFLSLSGFISGFFDNRVVYNQIPLRLRRQRFLKKLLPEKHLTIFTNYVERNLGKFMGNFSLGVFLGSAGVIGYITGLPIDIRHIAFSSANFGIALETLGAQVATGLLLTTLLGVAAIGLFNFLVSFGITLFIAMESRKITFKQTRQLTFLLIKHFVYRPLDFFLTPGKNLAGKYLGKNTTT